MMKRIPFVIFILVIASMAFFVYDNNDDNNIIRGSSRNPFDDWQGLRLYAAADDVMPTGLRLTIINDSDTDISYGKSFFIHQYSDGEWRQVPFIGRPRVQRPLFVLSPNGARNEDICWEYWHGSLPPGQYRLVRRFSEYSMFPRRQSLPWQVSYTEAFLYAAFTIE